MPLSSNVCDQTTMQAEKATTQRQLFPFVDLQAQYASISAEIVPSVTSVLERQQFILGREVEALEREIADLVGCRFAIGCASGSDALLLSLMARGIGPGDEVITTPFTFIATASSIARLQARPIFVDIDPATYNLNANQLNSAITHKTRAIIPVHLFGLPAEMDSILEIAKDHGLDIIEDAAQSIGAQYRGKPVGGLGRCGCFSFFPSKNLGGAGDGGMVTTNDPEMADRLRILRSHGSRKKYEYEMIGINSRLDEIQAAILRVKLGHLKSWTSARQRNVERYRRLVTEYGLGRWILLPAHPKDLEHVYNQFVIRTRQRDELERFLTQTGIPTQVYYPSPLHLQPAFADLGYRRGDFPEAERASQEVLSLPIFAELTEDQQRVVVSSISRFYDQ
jgi:dTDP-4-amino-4,6-dideoxygalactose transaminase